LVVACLCSIILHWSSTCLRENWRHEVHERRWRHEAYWGADRRLSRIPLIEMISALDYEWWSSCLEGIYSSLSFATEHSYSKGTCKGLGFLHAVKLTSCTTREGLPLYGFQALLFIHIMEHAFFFLLNDLGRHLLFNLFMKRYAIWHCNLPAGTTQ
jgi:hypothetical protein